MPVIILVRTEPSGAVSVDYQKTRERVVMVDFRVLEKTRFPSDIAAVVRDVRELPSHIPWRTDILKELEQLFKSCREAMISGRIPPDGPDLPDAG